MYFLDLVVILKFSLKFVNQKSHCGGLQQGLHAQCQESDPQSQGYNQKHYRTQGQGQDQGLQICPYVQSLCMSTFIGSMFLTDCCTPITDVASRRHLRSASRCQLLVPRHNLSTSWSSGFFCRGSCCLELPVRRTA